MSCKQNEVHPIQFYDKVTVRQIPHQIILKSGNDTLLKYIIETIGEDTLKSIMECQYHPNTHTIDTNICQYQFVNNQLVQIHWQGFEDLGINGKDVSTQRNYQFEYDSSGALIKIDFEQESISAKKISAILLNSNDQEIKKVLLLDRLTNQTDTMFFGLDQDYLAKFVKFNNFYELIYKKDDGTLHSKDIGGGWNLKARFCSLKNPLYKTFWPLIHEFARGNANVISQRHFTALCPEVSFFFSSYIQDCYGYFPVEFDGKYFWYFADPHARLKQLKSDGLSFEQELSFEYD